MCGVEMRKLRPGGGERCLEDEQWQDCH